MQTQYLLGLALSLHLWVEHRTIYYRQQVTMVFYSSYTTMRPQTPFRDLLSIVLMAMVGGKKTHTQTLIPFTCVFS